MLHILACETGIALYEICIIHFGDKPNKNIFVSLFLLNKYFSNKNGKNSPIDMPEKLSVIKSAIPEFCNIAPKIPPAPVTKIIGAAIRTESPNHPEAEYTFSSNL